jgi:cytochrome c oxidase cbb3-type subunit III
MKRTSKRIGMAVLAATFALGPAGMGVAQADEIPEANPMSGDKKAIREGRSWFVNVCSPCHGGRADGAGERGTAADLRVWNKGFKRFVETVKKGKDSGRTMTMPAWGGVLDDKTILQISAYVESLAIEGANWKEGAAPQ